MTSIQELKQCNTCNLSIPISSFYKTSGKCNKCKYNSKLCPHGKQKSRCKEGCGGTELCEHGRRQPSCKDCGGDNYCVHNKLKKYCKEGCGGSAYCIHGKVKKICREGCGFSVYCIHGKVKHLCKEGCGGSQICIHGKVKHLCKEGCGVSYYCIHNELKYYCKEGCGGSLLCVHLKRKSRCKECKGSDFCIHGNIKYYCKEAHCIGTSICKHNKQRYSCIECTPEKACQLCKGKYVKKSTRFYPLCEACFSFTYPESEIITAYKIRERYLCDELKEFFKDETVKLTFDKIVEGGCSRRRPDVLIDKLTHCVVIECDEDQHKNYECENKRTMELFIDLGNRPLVIIRFNPDGYIRKDKTKEKSCFKPMINAEDINRKRFYDLIKPEWERRINVLISEIKKYIDLNTFPNKEITIVELFYDNFD